MKQPVDKTLIRKFIANDCTPEEKEQIREFLKQPGSDYLFEEILNEDWRDKTEVSADEQQLQTWESKFDELIKAPGNPAKIRPFKIPSFIKYAAMWVAAAGTFGYGWYQFKKQQVPAAIAMLESHTRAGQLVKLQLQDSTIVYLNAASTIKYPESFTGKLREVELTGEAFFEVKHDSKHPFIIHTDNLKVQVLGTSFNVKSYDNDKDVAVTVATGKVGVSVPLLKEQAAEILLPNKQFTYNKNSKEINVLTINADDTKSWETGLFVFNYETMENITNRLSRWYGVEFEFKNKELMQKRFKLKQKNEALDIVMQSLSLSGNGFHYKITGKKVTIW